MIVDRLTNAPQYDTLHPLIQRGFSFLASPELESLDDGVGDLVFVGPDGHWHRQGFIVDLDLDEVLAVDALRVVHALVDEGARQVVGHLHRVVELVVAEHLFFFLHCGAQHSL